MSITSTVSIIDVDEFVHLNVEGEDIQAEFWGWVAEMEASGKMEELRSHAKFLQNIRANEVADNARSAYDKFIKEFEEVMDAVD